MASMAGMRKRGRSWLVAGAFVVVGIIVGQALPPGTVVPKTATGTVTSVSPAMSGTDFVLKPKTGTGQKYHLGQPTPWQDGPKGSWHATGRPTCLKPGTRKPQQVTIGYITIAPIGAAPGRSIVVWVECGG